MTSFAKATARANGSSDRIFYVLASISLLLVALIAADGVRKGLDTMVPGYLYRHEASLAIAISELAYGTSGLVGLVEVEEDIQKLGFLGSPGHWDRLIFLNTHPEQADAILRSAADLTISDRSKTLPLYGGETGMIDYYYLALKLFGYHVRAIYALYISILGLIAFCFICSFRHGAIFIVPSILYLLLLFAEQHALSSTDLEFSPLTNSRLLPYLSLYPVLFCLTVIGANRNFRVIDAVSTAIAGLVFAFVVNARTYAYWQIGPLLTLALLAITARILPWRLPERTRLVRLSVYPVLVFGLCAGAWIGIHHWRRDAKAYNTATFAGHVYWQAYASITMPFFQSRIPDLEQQSGTTISGPDSYDFALMLIKIKQRGEKLNDYFINGQWNLTKSEGVARQIVLDLWRDHPVVMIASYIEAFKPIGSDLLTVIGLIALAVVATGVGPHTFLTWLLRTAVLIAIGGISGGIILGAVALRYALPAARRLSTIVVPVSILGLWLIPNVIVLPWIFDAGTADRNFVVWLCLSIFACCVRLPIPAGTRFWRITANGKRSLASMGHGRSSQHRGAAD